MRDQKLKFLVVDALFAVIIALLAQVAIPLGPIPLTGQTFAIGLGCHHSRSSSWYDICFSLHCSWRCGDSCFPRNDSGYWDYFWANRWIYYRIYF